MKLSIRVKLTILLIFASTVPVSLLGLSVVENDQQVIEHDLGMHMVTHANLRANHIETYLKSIKGSLKDFASDGKIKDCLEDIHQKNGGCTQEQLSDHLVENKLPALSDAFEVFTIDIDGRVVASTDEQHIGLDEVDNPYFTFGKKVTYIKDIYYPTNSTMPIFTVSAPVIKGESLVGVVVVILKPDTLYSILQDRTGLEKTGETYILNRDKEMITPSLYINDAILKQKVDTINFNACIEQVNGNNENPQVGNSTYYTYESYYGKEVLGTNIHLNQMDWCLITEIETSEIFEPIDQLRKDLLFSLLILSSTALILASYFGGLISKPIKILKKGAEEIGKGDLNYKIGLRTDDELGQLADSFNEMTKNLSQVTASKKDLEKEITERKEAEKQLKRINKELEESKKYLEVANRELDNFAHVISHDLKSPLSSIESFSTLLLEDIGDSLDETSKDYLQRIDKGAKRMRQSITEILRISEVEKGDIEFSKIDLNEVTELVLEDLAPFIQQKGAVVNIGKMPSIRCNRVMLVELFTNLIDNGIKYNKQKHPLVDVKSTEDKSHYEFTIIDNGIGIEEKYHERVFKLFERLHSSSEYGGSGAGLAIISSICERHNGRVWIEKSSLGNGTTIKFTISKSL